MFYYPGFWLFILPAIILGFIAQAAVRSKFNKYSQVRTYRGLTGAEVARQILDTNGLYDVSVEETQGFLSDHYDPRSRTLRLSPDVARAPSVAAVGVAAHEAGHALQPWTVRYYQWHFLGDFLSVERLGAGYCLVWRSALCFGRALFASNLAG
jgi:Zn-dependent membrane protease YugP